MFCTGVEEAVQGRWRAPLAEAGLIGRHDAERGVLVIESAKAPIAPPDDADVQAGTRTYNAWTRAERARWHDVARSADPADAVAAFRATTEQARCQECSRTGFEKDATCEFCDASQMHERSAGAGTRRLT